MLRLARFQAVRPLVAQRAQARRNFVSPVILTRTWENENVTTLRKEAKNRGLSSYVVISFFRFFSSAVALTLFAEREISPT